MNIMNNNPLVSIIIPVYNGENYLKEAIDSALSQTYKNIEVIVVNDGSTDATKKIALSYGKQIRYFEKENGGVSSALNFGIKQMNGEYFSWLSHDDKYYPQKIEFQIKKILYFGDTNSISFCNSIQINKNGEIIKKRKENKLLKYDSLNNWKDSLNALFKTGGFYGCSLLIPKASLNKTGGFNNKLRYCQDFLLWVQLLVSGCSIVYCEEYCVMNRVHDKQLTQSGTELLYHDTKTMTQLLYADLKNNSNKCYNFIFSYAKYCSKYNCKSSVAYIIDQSKKDKTLTFTQIVLIKIIGVYGTIRPLVRRLYYKFFKGVKVKR